MYHVEASPAEKQRAAALASSKTGCEYNDIFSVRCRDSKVTESSKFAFQTDFRVGKPTTALS